MDKRLALNECEEVKELIDETERAFLLLGEKLSHVYRQELWHCGQWDSWEGYCDYLGKGASVISRIIKVYEVLIEKYEIEPTLLTNIGGWDTAYRVASLAKNKAEAVKILKDIRSQSPQNREILLREAKTGIVVAECKHKRTYTIEICEDCGQRIKVDDT